MPSRFSIIETWKPFFKERGIDIKNQCFACSFPIFLERSHILSKTYGGSDEPENIHLLCKFCHLESEFLDNKNDYFKWLFSKSKDNSLSWNFILNISKLESFIGLSHLEIISKIDDIKRERVKKKLNESLKKNGEWRTGKRKDGTFVLNEAARIKAATAIRIKAEANPNTKRAKNFLAKIKIQSNTNKLTLSEIAAQMNANGFLTASGRPFNRFSVFRLMKTI